MPFQHLREEPNGPLFIVPLGLVCLEGREEASLHCADLRKASTQFLWRLTGLRRRSWQFTTTFRYEFPTSLFKPISQPQRRQTIVSVVALDSLKQIADFSQIIPKGHRRFVRLEGEICVMERHSAGKAVERFESLDGIALYRSSDALPDGAVEIDEDSRPQQFIHFIDARPMSSDQPLDCRRLVWGIVVEVHFGIPPPPLHHLCYEGLKCILLFRAAKRPKGFVVWLLI